MQQLIHKYFAMNRTVSLPGIGSFTAEMQNAKLDFIEKSLHAPGFSIRYDSYDKADDAFFIFLTKETGNGNARERFSHFLNELKTRLENDHIVTLPGIGILTKNGFGYSFVADNSVQKFFPTIVAERVIRQDAEHTVKVGEQEKTSTEMHAHFRQRNIQADRWYVAALILGAIGVAAIALYYIIRR